MSHKYKSYWFRSGQTAYYSITKTILSQRTELFHCLAEIVQALCNGNGGKRKIPSECNTPLWIHGREIKMPEFISCIHSTPRTNYNLLAPELFFLILAHPVYKMWLIQVPNMLELWNKLHFEEKITESIYHVKNIQYLYLLNKYIKCNFRG